MSNFDYLMVLNDFAGRNYHDLSQYPVFPWVISNYSSTAIDLSDESNFRDLSKPVGAQTKERERLFRKKYQETKEMCETSSNDEEGRILHGYPRHYATLCDEQRHLGREEGLDRNEGLNIEDVINI